MGKRVIGVITGDLVGSQKIKSEKYDNMLYTLQSSLSMLQSHYDMSFETYRGDAFQGVFDNPIDAIFSAVIIRLSLKAASTSFDVRQSVGIGELTTRRSEVKTSTGEAFTLSGKGLDTIKNDLIKVTSNNSNFQLKVGLLTKFLDNLLSDLTLTQSETLLCYLLAKDKSHAALAEALGKTRSNITKLLLASRYQLVDEYLHYVAQCYEEEFSNA
ncbi:hypothetical protein [Paraglaciecola sp. 2405UD69-4]|uniref:hypothetical protein n=1 Tax=Paraglaciecola sp. 2405UD69-4 TaxID=3391836 RepID=UPI0039C8DF68